MLEYDLLGMDACDHEQGPCYWEEELQSIQAMKPVSFFSALPSLSLKTHDVMKILSRSRNGKRIVCSTQAQVFVFEQEDGRWELCLKCQSFSAEHISRLILTDAEPVALNVWAISSPSNDDLHFEEPAEQSFHFEVPPNALLVEMASTLHVGLLHLDGIKEEAVEWHTASSLSGQAFSSYIHTHILARTQALTASASVTSDFVMIKRIDQLSLPSVTSCIKMNGRPSFSLDKGPRTARVPPLSEEDENQVFFSAILKFRTILRSLLQSVFCFLVVLKTVHSNIPPESGHRGAGLSKPS